MLTGLKEAQKLHILLFYESFFGPRFRNKQGYVTESSNNALVERRFFQAQLYSMVALLGPKGLVMYKIIKDFL